MKYYGTLVIISVPDEILTKYNSTSTHKQFRIVCKAKSRADANRKLESITGYKNVFTPNFTSVTGNQKEIESADKYDAIINLDSSGYNNYHSLSELMKEINDFKSV